MAYIPEQQTNVGSFVPTTEILANLSSQDDRTLIINLYQYVSNIAHVLNLKETGLLLTEEFCNSKLLFHPTSFNQSDLRPCFTKVIDMGALEAGITQQLHNLAVDVNWKMVNIYGAASNTAALLYYPLPFAGVAGNNIEVTVNGTHVIINNNSGVAFTDAYIILEYVKY